MKKLKFINEKLNIKFHRPLKGNLFRCKSKESVVNSLRNDEKY
jgi:hypothetical protein